MTLEELYDLFYFKIIDKYNQEINSLEEEISKLELVLSDLEKGKISKLASRVVQELFGQVLTNYNLNNYMEAILANIGILNHKIEIILKNKQKCWNLIDSIEYDQVIYYYLFDYIKEELKNENIDGKLLVLTFENIKKHNLKFQTEGKLSGLDLSNVANIINFGFEKIAIKYLENSKNAKDYVKKLIDLIDNNSLDIVEDNITLNYFTYEEQEYILKNVLRHYQEEMYKLNLLVKTEEFYFDNETLKTIIYEFKGYLNRYLYIRNKLNNLKREEEIKEDVSPKIIEITNQNNLYYSTNSNEASKCYFIKDLMSIREESLETVLNLLNNFREGDTSRIKYLTDRDCFELKGDQVRVILRRIVGNNYSVLGVFIKKADNDHKTYNIIDSRPDAIIDNEYSRMVEDYYQEYIENNKRSGSRK